MINYLLVELWDWAKYIHFNFTSYGMTEFSRDNLHVRANCLGNKSSFRMGNFLSIYGWHKHYSIAPWSKAIARSDMLQLFSIAKLGIRTQITHCFTYDFSCSKQWRRISLHDVYHIQLGHASVMASSWRCIQDELLYMDSLFVIQCWYDGSNEDQLCVAFCSNCLMQIVYIWVWIYNTLIEHMCTWNRFIR